MFSAKVSAAILAVVFLCCFFSLSGEPIHYPETPALEVVHEYGSVRLPDDFAWLENNKGPEAEAWYRAQDSLARTAIATMPGREGMFQRIKEIDEAKTVQVYSFNRRRERYFYLKREVGQDVGHLYYQDGVNGERKLILDPASVGTGDGVFSIEYYNPSPDGKTVAVGISVGGNEIPDLYLIDVELGTLHQTIFPRVRSSPQWLEEGTGFYYTQMRPEDPDEPPAERYSRQSAQFHSLGSDPSTDRVLVSHDQNPTPGMSPVDTPYIFDVPETKYTMVYISHGVETAVTLFYAKDYDPLSSKSMELIQLCDKADRVEELAVHNDTVFFLSTKNAPRGKILKGDLREYARKDREVHLPETDKVLSGLTVLGGRLYLTAMHGGIDLLMVMDLTGPENFFHEVEMPLIGSITMVQNDYRMEDIYLSLTSWTQAPAYYRFDPHDKSIEISPIRPLGPFDKAEGLVTKRVIVESHDGVEVPLTIVHHESVELDGMNPTILYGYGAYKIALRPSFSPTRLAWFEKGGIFCVAHVRGGGEFGEEWHQGGHLETKRNSWLDFNACAEYLINQKYTSSPHLGGYAGSMGGVLVGRAMTSRPELYGAIVSSVGNHNPVRNHMRANGPANYPEYGNPLNPEEFPYTLAMDSYFAVQDGVDYPPMLLTCGYNDARVDPWMPGKMAARLQQANPAGGPYFLRVGFDAGHGGVARSDVWEEVADIYTFFLWSLDSN